MSNSHPLISIIILNYNQVRVTSEFIESTRKLTYPNYEIILVDNASEEDPTNFIGERYPHVRVIRNRKNLGFTGGNNVGIRAARGDYYFIVNNDTEVTPDLLDRLLEPFRQDASIGVVSPKIRYFTHPQIIQYAGFTEVNPFTGRNRPIGMMEEDRGQHDTPAYTPYAHGAAMMVRREVVDLVGQLPDIFFIYYEELDWSAHIRKAGYKIFYQPSALIYHKESITMGKKSAIKEYYHTRNRILFMRRNTNGFQFTCFLLFLIVFIIPKKVMNYTLKRQPGHLKSLFRGVAWNMVTPKYVSQELPVLEVNLMQAK